MQRSYRLFETEATALGSRWVTDGVAASSTNTYYSKVMTPDQYADIGFTLETTGNLTGVWTLWYSDEDNPALDTDTDWDQDTSWAPTNPAAAATYEKYVIDGIKARFIRVKYVNASGTGLLKGYTSGD